MESFLTCAFAFCAQANNAKGIKLKKKESNTNSVQNNGAIKLATWNPDTPYLTKIKEATEGEMYSVYLTQKEEYGNSPSFFKIINEG